MRAWPRWPARPSRPSSAPTPPRICPSCGKPADPSRTYAYISDTLPLKAVANEVKGADLLYHEATFLHDLAARAKETCHTTALQAATLARDAEVKRLLIGHFSSRYADDTPLLDEARSVFPETLLANEGLTLGV